MISRKRILAFIYYPREMIHKPEVHRDEDYIQNMGTAIFYLELPASRKERKHRKMECAYSYGTTLHEYL